MNEDPSKLKLSSEASVESIDKEISDLVRNVEEAPTADSAAPQGRAAAKPLLSATSAPMIAAASALLCLSLTMFNLGFFSREGNPPTLSAAEVRADLEASLEVDVALLQSHRELYGSYPADPEEAGLDPEGAFYMRVSPLQFTLTREDGGYAVSVDSEDLPKDIDAKKGEGIS